MKKSIPIILFTIVTLWACVDNPPVLEDIGVRDHGHYIERYDHLETFASDCDIIFLGDSRIYHGSWEDQNEKWCNWGIGGDTAFGLRQRINMVTESYATDVVIQIGYNDLNIGVPVETILTQLKIVTDKLYNSGSGVYITSTILSKSAEFNQQINLLNQGIEELCYNDGLIYIDLNDKLAPNGFLIYTVDGVHLTNEGYSFFYDDVITSVL